jgi:cell division septation protein DedD
MSDIDAQLRDVFARVSEPGDPTGVVDSIRTRMDAGDTGTPSTSSGFGSGGGWAPTIAPWAGLVLIAGLIGGGMGAAGVFGHPDVESGAVSVSVTGGADGLACPAGLPLERFVGGERVVATQRSDDSAYLAVRDPYNLALTVWLPADLVIVDADQAAIQTLPVGGCPIAEVVEEEPTPTPPSTPSATATAKPTPKPTTQPTTKPKPDTTKPSLSVGSFSPNPVYGMTAAPYCDTKTTVTVTATDNKGISSVKASASFGTVTQKSHSGTTWIFEYSADYNSGSDKTVTVTFTAKDAAGNKTVKTKTLTLVSAGNCLI